MLASNNLTGILQFTSQIINRNKDLIILKSEASPFYTQDKLPFHITANPP